MKDILGYEGLYSIDESGNIFSYRKQRLLKPYMGSDGYLHIGLRDADGNRKQLVIHRLVALTYIPNPNNLPVVDHIDRNKLNNSVENLRWVTHRENILNRDLEQFREKMREKMRENYRNMSEENRKERTRKANQASVQVCSKAVEMRDKDNHDILIKIYSSAQQAAIQEFGDATKKSGISQCARGKLKSAYGYFWVFASTTARCEEET